MESLIISLSLRELIKKKRKKLLYAYFKKIVKVEHFSLKLNL